MRSLLVSLVLLVVPAGLASANDAGAPPPASDHLDSPAKLRPIAIHDSVRGEAPGRSCERNALGQVECKGHASNDAAGEKPPAPPAPAESLEPPAKTRPIAIHDSIRDGSAPGRSCERNAMGQLECKAAAITQ
jgi:hypothetical protein